jgi:hypothetical protein
MVIEKEGEILLEKDNSEVKHEIAFDEDGNLTLAITTPKEFKVLSKAEVLKNKSWTIPTVVGKTLYMRDKKTIMAMDIG